MKPFADYDYKYETQEVTMTNATERFSQEQTTTKLINMIDTALSLTENAAHFHDKKTPHLDWCINEKLQTAIKALKSALKETKTEKVEQEKIALKQSYELLSPQEYADFLDGYTGL